MSHLGGASVAPLDFAKVMEAFEQHHVAFVSVTQHFNSATSMGRLVLNVLLSFAQFVARNRPEVLVALRSHAATPGVASSVSATCRRVQSDYFAFRFALSSWTSASRRE